jgi:hypothetical protein
MNDQRQPNPYDPAIEALRVKRDAIDNAIRFLESIRDGSFLAGTNLLSTGAALAGPASPPMVTPGDIGPGAFHGMGILESVKKLLQVRKRKMGAQELAAELRDGGLLLQSEDPAKSIASTLHRSFMNGGEIVRVDRGMWGLAEWYPNQRFNRKVAEE